MYKETASFCSSEEQCSGNGSGWHQYFYCRTSAQTFFLKNTDVKKMVCPSHLWFILISATTDGFQVHSKFDNKFSGPSHKKTTFSVISEVLFCVCSKRSSENSQFLLCSRFQTYVLPSLLVITQNSSSLGSIFSIVFRKEATLSTSL